MELMACQAGHGGLISKIRAPYVPRPCGVLWLYQIANAAIEMHSMAAQAIVIQAALCVVYGVRKDTLVCRAVRARIPCGVLALVTSLTAGDHLHRVNIAETNSLGQTAEQMHANMPKLGRETRFMAVQAGRVAMG